GGDQLPGGLESFHGKYKHPTPVRLIAEGAGDHQFSFTGQTLDIREVSPENFISGRTIGCSVRSSFKDNEDVIAHSMLISPKPFGLNRVRNHGVCILGSG